jgi:hypothetical protein
VHARGQDAVLDGERARLVRVRVRVGVEVRLGLGLGVGLGVGLGAGLGFTLRLRLGFGSGLGARRAEQPVDGEQQREVLDPAQLELSKRARLVGDARARHVEREAELEGGGGARRPQGRLRRESERVVARLIPIHLGLGGGRLAVEPQRLLQQPEGGGARLARLHRRRSQRVGRAQADVGVLPPPRTWAAEVAEVAGSEGTAGDPGVPQSRLWLPGTLQPGQADTLRSPHSPQRDTMASLRGQLVRPSPAPARPDWCCTSTEPLRRRSAKRSEA